MKILTSSVADATPIASVTLIFIKSTAKRGLAPFEELR